MKKVALYGIFTEDAKKQFATHFEGIFETVIVDHAEQYEKLADVEYIITRSFTIDAKVFSSAPRLVLLQKWGAAYSNIDIAAASDSGVSVAICPGANAVPVAELTVLLILAVYRNIIPLSALLQKADWAANAYMDRAFMLQGKTVGLIGFGNVGRRVGEILKRGFSANVQYYDLQRMPEEKELALGFRYVELDKLFETSNVVSIHLPLIESTRKIIGEAELYKMRPDAILINTARGGIVDETALAKALKRGVIAGAGIDTFEQEPLGSGSPLLDLENVVLTPHIGGNTADNVGKMVRSCVSNILEFEEKGTLHPPVLVNREHLENGPQSKR